MRAASWLVSTVFLVTVLAGCVGNDGVIDPPVAPEDPLASLSQPIFSEIERLHIQVPGHDGALQDTWVFKPKLNESSDDVRFPVFINFSPYWYNLAGDPSTGGDKFSQHMIERYVPRGYAIVLASVRGTGHSEGCFPIGGIKELEDAYAVVDHFANVEWSSGAVAAGGKSYDGTTIQGLVGYKPHDALKLVFPVSGISDLYRYNYRNGVPYFHGPIFNTYYYVGVGTNQYSGAEAVVGQGPTALAGDVACADMPLVQANGVGTAATGMYNDYWDERDYNNYAADIETAFFFVHGLQDWNVKPDHILPWLDNIPADVPVKVWLHQWQQGGTGHVYPMRDDWNLTMDRMLDHFLKDIDTGVMDEPRVQVQDSTGAWRNEDTWPPLHMKYRSLVALSDDAEEMVDLDGGGVEYRFPLTETLHYAGEPRLKVRLATSNPEAVWVAQLWLEDDEGRTWMNEGVLKARLRESLYEPSVVAPLQMYNYEIPFYPQDDVFPAGSTLVLQVKQSDARMAMVEDVPASFAIDHEQTILELPLLSVENVTLESPQPTPMYCFTC